MLFLYAVGLSGALHLLLGWLGDGRGNPGVSRGTAPSSTRRSTAHAAHASACRSTSGNLSTPTTAAGDRGAALEGRCKAAPPPTQPCSLLISGADPTDPAFLFRGLTPLTPTRSTPFCWRVLSMAGRDADVLGDSSQPKCLLVSQAQTPSCSSCCCSSCLTPPRVMQYRSAPACRSVRRLHGLTLSHKCALDTASAIC